MRTLTAALLSLLLLPAASAQDDTNKMEWAIQEGDAFDLTWSFNEQRKREPGKGEVTEMHDKRDVTAELAWKADGVLAMTIKKATWSNGTQDYDILLAFTEGKKSEPQLKMKIAQGATNFASSKGDADRMVENMKRSMEGEYTVDLVQEKGRTLVLWNGSNVRLGSGTSMLARLFTHPLLPSGPVRVGQIFKDPLDVTNLPAGVTDIRDVESKVTAVSEKGLVAKGGLTVPYNKSSEASAAKMTTTGSYTYVCEWNYAPLSHLQSAREESKFTKKTDATGRSPEFYKENFSHSIVQTLTIKKKPADPNRKPAPKPDPKKPDEPKPGDDKKPDEK